MDGGPEPAQDTESTNDTLKDVGKSDTRGFKPNQNDAELLFPHLQYEHSARSAGVSDDIEAQKLEGKAQLFLAKQTQNAEIPDFASWFDFDKIHELEKRSLPDFFDDSSIFKTPKAYQDVRNFIINTYRLSKHEYLTATAVRRNVAMDVASTVRIHNFLETWGLINYQVDPRSRPSMVGPGFTGHFNLILDTPQGLKPGLEGYEVRATGDDTEIINATDENNFSMNLQLRRNIFDDEKNINILKSKKDSVLKRFTCHLCGFESVTISSSELKFKSAGLCSKCFQKEDFDSSFEATNYGRLQTELRKDEARRWSDQDVVLLLEALEMFKDNWVKISTHVCKDIEECIDKFLTLPYKEEEYGAVSSSNKRVYDQFEKDKPLDRFTSLDLTIKALIDGKHDDRIGHKIIENAKTLQEKHLKKAEIIVQELIQLKSESLKTNLDIMQILESTLNEEKTKYQKGIEEVQQFKQILSKEVGSVNEELEKLSMSKKLVMSSEQIDTGLELMEQDKTDGDNDKDQESVHEEEASLSHVKPQLYKPWSL